MAFCNRSRSDSKAARYRSKKTPMANFLDRRLIFRSHHSECDIENCIIYRQSVLLLRYTQVARILIQEIAPTPFPTRTQDDVFCFFPIVEGVVKGCGPFSPKEKAGMRGYINQSVSFSDSLTPTLSRGERGLLRHPPQGEGTKPFATLSSRGRVRIGVL